MTTPEILWHYTTIGSFQKIVEQNRLLATKATHLNDATEFVHGWELLRQVRNSEKEIGTHAEAQEDFERLADAQAPYVFSLSEKGDLLSQWRAYAHPTGVAVGFEHNALSDLAEHNNFFLHRCLYSDDEKKEFIKKTEKGGEYNSKLTISYDEESPSLSADYTFVRMCALLKHPSFTEEHEFRVVSEIADPPVEPTEWLETTAGPIPKKEIKPQSDNLLPIRTLRLSPGCDFEREKRNLENFLKYHGYDAVEIVASKIPYRTNV